MLANFSNLITFSRGSNATVTDASGRLTYAANNQVSNSQDFEAAAWTKNSSSITANSVVAPDGSRTADTWTPTSSGNTGSVRLLISANLPVGPIATTSIYVKNAGRRWVYLSTPAAASPLHNCWFDLQNGVVGTRGSAVLNATITPAGDGWYRISATSITIATTNYVFLSSSDADNSTTVTADGNGVYVWGAQLEISTYQTTPSPYVSTSVANLIGFSEAFDNAAWAKTRASIVPNAAQNPINGLWNAQKFMEDTTASNSHFMFQTATVVANTRYVQSVYAKAGERNWMWMTEANNVTAQAYFDLANGVVGTVSGTGSPTAAITPVGNGWYRCSLAFTPIASAANVQVRLANGNGSGTYTGDGNSGIYIYGAQLSNSGSLDPYVPTPGAAPSSTAYYGPRFDYDPVTLAAKGILIEEQRTNLLTYSEQFDNAAWVKSAATITANTAVAPSGAMAADTITEDTTNAGHSAESASVSFTSGVSYTLSVYAKAATGTRGVCLRFSSSAFPSASRTAFFSIASGTVVSNEAGTTASITNVGNGWYRCTMTATANATATVSGAFIIMTDASNNRVYTGDGTGSLYIYGAQLEAGAFATSYIPTVASTVTRSADVAQITGSLFSQWYRQDEGTFVVQVDSATTGYRTNLQVDDGTLNNRILIQTNNVATAQQYYVVVGGSAVVNTAVQPYSPAGSKTSATYKLNDYAYSVNGTAVTTDTSATVPAVNRMFLGTEVSSNYLNGHIQNITYIPNAISGTQLQSQTAS